MLINNCFFHLHLRLDKPHNAAMLQNILKVDQIIITIVHHRFIFSFSRVGTLTLSTPCVPAQGSPCSTPPSR